MITLFTCDDLLDAPEPEWIADGWIAARDIVLLFGPTGVGKSFITMDLLHSVAVGRPWCGLPTHQQAVLYVAAEGASGFAKRVRAWMSQRGKPDDARYALEAVPFGDGDRGVSELIEACRAAGFQPGLIAIDTLAASMLGGDESSAQDIGVVVGGLKLLRDAFGAAVLVVDHTGWDEARERGSSSKRQHVEVVIECKAVGSHMTQLTVIKSRNAQRPAPVTVRLAKVGEALLPDLVASTPQELTAHEIAMLRALQKGPLRHGTWLTHCETTKPTFNRYLPTLLSREYVQHLNEKYLITQKGLTALSVSRSHGGLTQSHDTKSPVLSHRSLSLERDRETKGPGDGTETSIEPGSQEELELVRQLEARERLRGGGAA